MYKKKYLILCVLLIILLYFLLQYFFIPKSIYMTTGESYVMKMDTFFDCEISSSQVLNINNKAVKDNIKIDLKNENTISSKEDGNAKINLKMLGVTIKQIELKFMPEKRVKAVGQTVGICVNTDGVLVLGVGSVKGEENKYIYPSKDIIFSGDSIIEANGIKINKKEDLMAAIQSGYANLTVVREGEKLNVSLKPIKSKEDGTYKLGIWVRDSTQGIGTITYYDSKDQSFGALGHPIKDVDTGKVMEIKNGEVLENEVCDIEKGKAGEPGALIGKTDFDKVIGSVEKNGENGIFGKLNYDIGGVEVPIGYKNDLKIGEAYIYCNNTGKKIEKYKIKIESINKFTTSQNKSFVVSIDDKRLIDLTGGIVQGMSGSPIIQNGKLVGAITHVFTNDPTKGYGIFIENMIDVS